MTFVLVLAVMAAQAAFVPQTAEERYVADLRAQVAKGDADAEVALGTLSDAGAVRPQVARPVCGNRRRWW